MSQAKSFLFNCHPQLLQSLLLQVEQPWPLEVDATKFPPEEKPKTEKSLESSSAPHLGHTGFRSSLPL
jgi:hypothetical protein